MNKDCLLGTAEINTPKLVKSFLSPSVIVKRKLLPVDMMPELRANGNLGAQNKFRFHSVLCPVIVLSSSNS